MSRRVRQTAGCSAVLAVYAAIAYGCGVLRDRYGTNTAMAAAFVALVAAGVVICIAVDRQARKGRRS